MKARLAVAATLVGASLVAVAAAQTTQAPPMQSILAGKKFVPPVKGAAEVDFVRGQTKREGTTLVTKIQVKNTSTAPIARLRIVETWYDKSGGTIPGGEGFINGLLQPGEVQTIEIRTPVNTNMSTSMLAFSHANGTVPKPHSVKSVEAGAAAKEPAAKNASATKKK
jgi:hypothetical protein